jgi:hypothetical protein
MDCTRQAEDDDDVTAAILVRFARENEASNSLLKSGRKKAQGSDFLIGMKSMVKPSASGYSAHSSPE